MSEWCFGQFLLETLLNSVFSENPANSDSDKICPKRCGKRLGSRV
jgi:hypothetical protein